MEVKFLASLLILGLISTVLAKGGGYRHRDGDRHHYGKHRDDDKMECRPPVTFDKLPMKCTVSEDCTTYSCSLDGDIVTLSLKIDVSHKPFSAEVSLKVPSKGFDWSHTFKNGDKIQVPGFPQRIMGREVADLYLMFKMYEDKMGHGMNFKLDAFITTSVVSEAVDVPLLQGNLPVDEDHPEPYRTDRHWGNCRFASWFKRQSKPVKASIIISAILVFALLVLGVVYCCKRRRSGKMVKVVPPSYEEATSTKTKVPLEPLVNEE